MAASLEPRVAVDVPPQPATRSAAERSKRGMSRFMEKAPFAAVSSRCLTRGQYSIDESERLRETVLAQAYLAVGGRVHGRVDPAAQVSQLVGAEHHLADARLAAAEDEVVRTCTGELELRLLDQEEVLDRLRQRTEAILGRRLQLAQLVLRLGQGEPAVQVDLERLRRDVRGWHVGVHARVDPNRPRCNAPLARELGHRLGEELDVELEAQGGHVAGLLVA